MPAGEVVLLVAIIAAAIAGIGAGAFKLERRRVRREWRRREGRDNRDRAVDDHEMVCCLCEKSVLASAGVWNDERWYHTQCFEKKLNERDEKQ